METDRNVGLETMNPRDALLCRVGRNLTNFQFLEHTIRSMLPSLRISGTQKTLQKNLTEAKRTFKKASLGKLSSSLHSMLYEQQPEEEGNQTYIEEPRFGLQLGIEASLEFVQEQKKALQKLVTERNRLVHNDLLAVDLAQAEACIKLSEKLDEQNVRICKQLTFFNQLKNSHSELLSQLKPFLESDEFLKLLTETTSNQ